MDHPLYGKKKKKIGSCPNPLFEQWLSEWRDDAAEKNMKSQYTYGKALKTLKKYPLRLECGKDCKILENFGDKICKMLDDRLAKHIAEFGSAAPVVMVTDDVELSPPKQLKVSRKKSPKTHGKVNGAAIPVHHLSDNSDEEIPQPARKRQKSGGGGGEREYIPQYRSGPYALLVALYKDQQTPNSLGFLAKNSLITKAQPLADKSFTMPDPGCRYTAWSSMGTLIKKGLVIKEGSPARYSLTDAGCQLAHRMEAVKAADSNDTEFRVHLPDDNPPVTLATEARLPSMQQVESIRKVGVPVGAEKKSLTYWYVAEDGSETLDKNKTIISISDDMEVGFLVKCRYTDLMNAGIPYRLDMDRPVVRDYVYAYLGNNDTEDMATATLPCPSNTAPAAKSTKDAQKDNSSRPTEQSVLQLPPFIETTSSKTLVTKNASNCVQRTTSAIVIDSEESSCESLPSLSISTDRSSKVSTSSASGDSGSKTDSSSLSLLERLSNKSGGVSRTTCLELINPTSGQILGAADRLKTSSSNAVHVPSKASPFLDPQENSQTSMESSQNSIKSLTSEDSIASQQSSWDTSFVLYPGTFDIILCVDNAEFYGKGKGCSKMLLPDLIKNGVNCDLRKLHIGDMLWVAREKTPPKFGEAGRAQGRELVLNYVIERKRMDDLVSSCIDGRYKEQKFRLKKCGLQHTMYLIEDYGSTQHFSLPEATIKQAIVNTQVIDGFQVKRTRDTKETVAYLTVFTRYLQSCFRNKTLFACSLDAIKEMKIKCAIDDIEQRLPVFEEFNQSSVKTQSLTCQEMFGKQLIQLHGMSAEKARAILGQYPTLQHLLKAYDRCLSEKEKENMLASIKCGKTLRSLGQSQSRQIHQLYNTQTALV